MVARPHPHRGSLRAIALCALFAAGLVGCASTSEPAKSPTPKATASSTPVAPAVAPEDPAVASIVISTKGVALLAVDGASVSQLDYFDVDVEPAIEALTDAFGFEPEVSHEEAVTHFAASTTRNWAGFQLVDLETDTRFPDLPNFSVDVATAEVAGIAIHTREGVRVGMLGSEVEPLSYRHWLDTGGTEDIDIYLLDQVPVEVADRPDYEPAALSVSVRAASPRGVVDLLSAPGANWGS